MKARRWTELVALFVVGPGLIALGPRWWVFPAILGGGVVSALLLLTDPTFRRRRQGAAPRGLAGVLLRVAAVWGALLVFALVQRGPAGLFLFPRARPGVWLLVLVLYPVLSAFPQELMYRTLFFHRYAGLFRRPGAAVAVNALLFGWAHVIVHNLTAMVLTTVGGLILAATYHRHRSTLLASLEHALYGDFVFSVGIGGMFVNGVRLASKLVR